VFSSRVTRTWPGTTPLLAGFFAGGDHGNPRAGLAPGIRTLADDRAGPSPYGAGLAFAGTAVAAPARARTVTVATVSRRHAA
jgi:hypothetical protein